MGIPSIWAHILQHKKYGDSLKESMRSNLHRIMQFLFRNVDQNGNFGTHSTVCPGSSDPAEKIFNISIVSVNEVYIVY